MLITTRYGSKVTHGGTAAVLSYNGGSIVELNEAKKQVESMQKEVTHFGRSL
ncbi:acyl dehydratase [Lactobacillus sp. UMNPBX7]|uniref:Acyl dehydratase n=1 Tax=Limosilactobacillus reuteri TaxID=1598 RepID=A0ABD6XDZ6_LIMRT|nr:acyl dehydratase [Limosilactobacillus reuteri]PEG80346.1 acyl dehydratase [Lactobacillus sp. UMNPBX18]PEG89162.1 acyl dehydratase [Lactobacillus sp. UMNPBX13]PEH00525.1 acyl dehydratase [Lactobacillus sp. UMNPBX7]PEH07483.1 acyl dehydratase [Lactobacillus sp. UMNPBX3]